MEVLIFIVTLLFGGYCIHLLRLYSIGTPRPQNKNISLESIVDQYLFIIDNAGNLDLDEAQAMKKDVISQMRAARQNRLEKVNGPNILHFADFRKTIAKTTRKILKNS